MRSAALWQRRVWHFSGEGPDLAFTFTAVPVFEVTFVPNGCSHFCRFTA